jgi:glutathione S-transferase
MLEELGIPYQLEYVDVLAGAQHSSEFHKKNPMGKLPTLVDGDAIVTESAAIGLYLADRYSYGVLAPKIDEAARATYLRWSLFAPSVIEPGCYAQMSKWGLQARLGRLGHLREHAGPRWRRRPSAAGPGSCGERFSMADVIFGGTVRYMLRFNMIEARPVVRGLRGPSRRAARVPSRPPPRNNAIVAEHKLGG